MTKLRGESLTFKVCGCISVICGALLVLALVFIAWKIDVVFGVLATIAVIGVLASVICAMESQP